MPETRDMGVDQEGEEQVLYYFLAPDGTVYENPDNHPLESLMKAFKKRGFYLRFAYNKTLNLLFFQDQNEMQPMVEERDPRAINAINHVVSWIQEAHESSYPALGNGTGYGEPPSSCQARRLSDYQVAWQYLSKYLSNELRETSLEKFVTPVDINIAEYYEEKGEEDEGFVKGFYSDGLTIMNKTFHGPTLVINKAPEIPPHQRQYKKEHRHKTVDYGIISMYIAAWYLKHFQEITGAVLSDFDKIYLTYNLRNLKVKEFGYDVFYVAYNPADGSYPVYPFATRTTETITKKDAQRDLGRKIAENLQKEGQPVPEGQLYSGPIVVFSYLPYRKQIVWQSVDPEISSDPTTSAMCSAARKQVVAWYGVNPSEVMESHDPSKHLPNISKMSHYHVAWQYIRDIMALRYGFDPDEYDIEVLECPRPVGDAIAAYISVKEDENQEVKDIRIGFGISIKFPFIAVNSLNDDYGLSLNALIHEYEHYINDVFLKKKERVNNKDFNDPTVSEEERTRRFLSYIASNKEHDAHVEQMVYMLHMGMTDRDIIDTFCPITNMSWRAEYRLILAEANKIFAADRAKKIVPKQYTTPKPAVQKVLDEEIARAKEPEEKPEVTRDVEASSSHEVKTSELDIGVNDWFWEGLQELINHPRQVNIWPDDPQNDTFNLSKIRHQPHVEQALEDNRDKDQGFLKSLEQLLRESQI